MKRAAADGALMEIEMEKRRKGDAGEVIVAANPGSRYGAVVRARTSDLEAPIMLLEGHKSEVLSMGFSPRGDLLASAGHEKLIFLWNVYGQCPNVHRLKGHTNAILQLQWGVGGDQLFTCSADKTVCIWDVEHLTRVKKIKASQDIVNTCAASRQKPFLVAGGDDGVARLWDTRAPKRAAQEYEGAFPVTSAAINDAGDKVFVGDTSGEITVWESRKEQVLHTLDAHTEMVTGLAMSPDNTMLLSNSADNTLRQWDVRPFVAGGDAARCVSTFTGHKHGVDRNLLRCAWHPQQKLVSCGSSDPPPHHNLWSTATGEMEYQLPGHKASINDVSFHPDGYIIGSCSSDRTIYLGELQEM
eukprot:TRINITY_DN14258_c0_g1_i1.p1 TRINITY_DN14258_c0_g1~~TRINITY_DN14258_c0_g1_i1.p1  ORF type:complete len:357 (+),score=120.72 TRINITY_DN14258_c0_g1_i1:89-1159(+)